MCGDEAGEISSLLLHNDSSDPPPCRGSRPIDPLSLFVIAPSCSSCWFMPPWWRRQNSASWLAFIIPRDSVPAVLRWNSSTERVCWSGKQDRERIRRAEGCAWGRICYSPSQSRQAAKWTITRPIGDGVRKGVATKVATKLNNKKSGAGVKFGSCVAVSRLRNQWMREYEKRKVERKDSGRGEGQPATVKTWSASSAV